METLTRDGPGLAASITLKPQARAQTLAEIGGDPMSNSTCPQLTVPVWLLWASAYAWLLYSMRKYGVTMRANIDCIQCTTRMEKKAVELLGL